MKAARHPLFSLKEKIGAGPNHVRCEYTDLAASNMPGDYERELKARMKAVRQRAWIAIPDRREPTSLEWAMSLEECDRPS